MNPMKKLYRCMHCCLAGRTPMMKPPVAFGAHTPAEVFQCITRFGLWTRCIACEEQALIRRARTTTIQRTTLPVTDAAGLFCSRCRLHRPVHYYDRWTLYNRKQNNKHCCNACKPAACLCTLHTMETMYRISQIFRDLQRLPDDHVRCLQEIIIFTTFRSKRCPAPLPRETRYRMYPMQSARLQGTSWTARNSSEEVLWSLW